MDAQSDCFVTGVFPMVLRLARYAGVAPLKFVKKKAGWRVRLSRGWSIYGYFAVTVCVVVTIGALISDLFLDRKESIHMQSNSLRLVNIMDASLGMLVASTAVYGAPGQMRSMIACLNQVDMIKSTLNIHLWPKCADKKKIVLFCVWVMVSVILISFDIAVYTPTIELVDSKTWISAMYSCYYCCCWILHMQGILFIMITWHIMYSFRAINESLRTLLHDGIMNLRRPSPQAIRHLAMVYTSACDEVWKMDRCYGPILLMMLGFFFLRLVRSPYHLIKNIFFPKPSNSTTIKIICKVLPLFWWAYHTTNLVLVIEPCHLTHMEMKITRELVSKLLYCANSRIDPLAAELELFVRHIILYEVSYSPLKFTKMSRSLMAVIIGSITTYLTMLK